MPELLTNRYLIAAIAISAFLQLAVTTVPFFRPAFGVVGLVPWQWVLVAGLALTPVTIVELAKILHARMRSRDTGRGGIAVVRSQV
jgi:magnesium-transporting ATPase (P-type)